jgi:hypothetical protein
VAGVTSFSRRQRDDVRASLLVDAARETHHDCYGARRPRVPATLTVETVSKSIRDLGELLVAAETDEAREWLVLRLTNRLYLLSILLKRGGDLRAS